MAEYRTVTNADGSITSHSRGGLIYRKKTYKPIDGQPKRLGYVDVNTPEELEVIRQGLLERDLGLRGYRYALVRRIVDYRWYYYPLHQLFLPREVQIATAAKNHTLLPEWEWVLEKRSHVRKLLDIQTIAEMAALTELC